MSDPPIHTDIDFGLINEHVVRAAASYDEEYQIRRRFEQSAAVHVDAPENLDLLTFVEIDEASKIQWVVVRGTDNFENIKSDIDIDKEYDEHAKVVLHSGFSECADAAYQFVSPLLRQDYETRVTGHSLGGAVAAILMMRLNNDGLTLGSCVTFGQPKVTDEHGVNQYRSLPLYRVINGDDPVPTLPPSLPIPGGFRHFGHEVHLTEHGTYEIFSEHQSERSVDGSFWKKLFSLETSDHHIKHYVAVISNEPVPGD